MLESRKISRQKANIWTIIISVILLMTWPFWKESATTPELGAIVSPNRDYATVCMDTPEGLDEILPWLGKDTDEAVRIAFKYGGQAIAAGDTVKVLDPMVWFGKARVRVTSTGRECYVVVEMIQRD